MTSQRPLEPSADAPMAPAEIERAALFATGQRPGDRRVRVARKSQMQLSRRMTALVHRVLGT